MQSDSGNTALRVTEEDMTQMMSFYMRILSDSVIRLRVLSDSTTRRMMADVMQNLANMLRNMPPEHLEEMQRMLRDSTMLAAPQTRSTSKPATKAAPRPAPKKPAATPAAKPADPHAGHKPPAKPAPKKPPIGV